MLRLRSIATGSSPPTPSTNGWSSEYRISISVTTVVAIAPIKTPCGTAPSALSANSNVYPKMTVAKKNSAIHRDVGITPTAP